MAQVAFCLGGSLFGLARDEGSPQQVYGSVVMVNYNCRIKTRLDWQMKVSLS